MEVHTGESEWPARQVPQGHQHLDNGAQQETLRRRVLHFRKLGSVTDKTTYPLQRTGPEFEDHELVVHTKFVIEAVLFRRPKSEARVIRRRTDEHDRAVSVAPTPAQSLTNQARP